MALKAILKSLDGLSDEVKKLYVKKDDAYHLDLEDLPEDPKLAEFREKNRGQHNKINELNEALKKFDGIDVDKVKELQETEKKLREKKLIDTGKLDELRETWLTPFKKEFTDQLDAIKKENEQLRMQNEKREINEELTKLATAKGLHPKAIDDMLSRGLKVFKLKDGKPAALGADGASILDKQGNPITMQTWLDALSNDAPHLFQSSNGGGANGNNGNGHKGGTITRADFEKMNPLDRNTFVREQVSTKKVSIID